MAKKSEQAAQPDGVQSISAKKAFSSLL